jgi:hypothetical protein
MAGGRSHCNAELAGVGPAQLLEPVLQVAEPGVDALTGLLDFASGGQETPAHPHRRPALGRGRARRAPADRRQPPRRARTGSGRDFTYCISLDPKADDYVSSIFGRQVTVIDNIARLPEKLPELFLALTK